MPFCVRDSEKKTVNCQGSTRFWFRKLLILRHRIVFPRYCFLMVVVNTSTTKPHSLRAP